MADSKKTIVYKVAMVAALVSLLVFFRAVFGDFVNYDDPRFVIENTGIRNFNADMIVSALTQQFSNDYWAPLTWISFAVDYHFWGVNPAGYHLVNILLHAVNTGLVVLVADKLFKQGRWICNGDADEQGKARYLYPAMLLMAGLLWGLHPLRVESVAWVSERKDVLYGMFALCSVLCYLRDAELILQGRGGRGGRRFYFYSLVLFVLALMAKPTSVFLPMLLVVADWYPYGRFNNGKIFKLLIEKLPYFALAAVVTALTVITMSKTTVPYSYNEFSFMDRVLISGHSVFEFCRLMVFPTGIHLFNTIAQIFANPLPTYARTCSVFAFTFYCMYAGRKNPAVIAVWLSFLIPLLPTLAFFQVGVDVTYSTRHSYLASVVPTIAAVALFAGYYKKISRTGNRYLLSSFITIVAIVMVSHVSMTEYLIGFWKNSGVLWSRVIEFNPIGRAYHYRALYLADIGRFSAAADDFMKAAEGAKEAGNPEAFNYYAYAGDAFNRSGRYEKAVAAFSTAIALNPWPEYYYNRGLALKRLGRLSEAVEDLRKADGNRGEVEFHKMW